MRTPTANTLVAHTIFWRHRGLAATRISSSSRSLQSTGLATDMLGLDHFAPTIHGCSHESEFP